MRFNAKMVLAALAIGGLCMGGTLMGPTAALAQPTGKDKPKAEKPKEHAEKHMAAKVGEPAPAFELTDTDGNKVSLAALTKEKKIVVLEWFNPECPYIKFQHADNKTMVNTAKAYKDKGVVWLAINSNAAGKPGSGKEANTKARKDWSIDFPVLLDESTDVARAYGAKTTPHMFVIDASGTLVYAGAIDDGKGEAVGKVNYVQQALDAVIKGSNVPTAETKPFGCKVNYVEKTEKKHDDKDNKK